MSEQGGTGREAREGELFRLLVENVKDYAIFVVDAERRVRSWNPGAERLLGYAEAEIVGQSADRFFTPEDIGQGVPQEEVRTALETGRGDDDRWHVRKDGSRFWSSGVMTPLRDEGGTLRGFAKIMRDRTDLKRAEEQLRRVESRRSARQAVTQVLAEAASVGEAAPLILRAVCEGLGWDVGALWAVDRQANVLRCVDVRSWGGVPAGPFEEVTRKTVLRPNGSLPGRVWHQDGPLWIPDVVGDPHFQRAAVAAQVGLHGAFACPIRLGNDFLGVIEFFSREIREPDPDLLEMMSTLGGQIGQFMERRRAEEGLRRSEARLQAILDNTPAIVYLVDAEGRFLLINRRWREVFGLTNEQVAGRPLHDFFPPGAAEQFRRNNQEVLRAGVPFEFEETVPQGDGTHTYLSVKVPFPHGAGDAPAICGISTDITERKRAEQALRESEERFRALMEQAPFSVQVFSPDGRTVRVNRAWEELWGVRLEQIEGYNVLDDRQLEARGVLHYIHRAFAGQPARIPAIEYNPNDTIPDVTQDPDPRRWLSAVIYPLKDGGGRVREVVLVHEDITARRRAEEALLAAHRELEARVAERTAQLARANQFLQALLENVQDGIVACDAEGVLTLFNRATRELHGLPEAPIPADRWAEHYGLYRADGRTRMTKEEIPLYRALRGERVRDAEMVVIPEGGPARTLLASGQAFYDERGGKLGAVASMHDITERKRAEEGLRKAHEELERRVRERTEELAEANAALRETDRRKDEFLATLAHELRNPLAPIRNSLQILKMPRVDAETAGRSREMMERQVQHLVRLVDDLLDVSRVMRGKIELRRERVELASVVARAVETVQPLMDARGHELAIDLPPESLPLEADPVRLSQVVGNLLTNAAKYTERGGHVRVTARREGDRAVLRVGDNGIGIAPDMLPRIFELFVQADHAAAHSQGGLGIGLTLVKNLVQMHHGAVEAHSPGLGKGSEFVVRLPLAALPQDEPTAHGEAPQRQGPPAAGRRVLVVDDNLDAADSLATVLRLQGHEVRVAHGGPEALEAANGHPPDLVFLDIGMPGMDGYEVARRLRQLPGYEGVVLVALTGWGTQEDRRRSAEAGFNEHLVKPVEPGTLEQLLAGLKLPKG